jgi:hypothetical protein
MSEQQRYELSGEIITHDKLPVGAYATNVWRKDGPGSYTGIGYMQLVPVSPDAEPESSYKIPFVECDTCIKKPGTPILCQGCLLNREAILNLTAERDRLKQELAAKTKALADQDAERAKLLSALKNLSIDVTGLIVSAEEHPFAE